MGGVRCASLVGQGSRINSRRHAGPHHRSEGPVDRTSSVDLRSLDAGSWFATPFAGEPIPTLEDGLRLLGELNLGANVEIKPSPDRDAETGHIVGRMLREQWPDASPPPLVSSFKQEALAAAREVASHLDSALIVSALPSDWARSLNALGCNALHCGHRRLSKPDAEQIRRAGYPLRIFTVNERALADKLFSWGAETVISDYPDRVL
jgi:glycerophosphoryl diester phosphodiesterase